MDNGPKPGMKPQDTLRLAAELFAERNKTYRSHYLRHGQVMELMFPDGVALKSVRDHNRFFALTMRVTKLMRYALAFDKGQPDSVADEINYAAIQMEVDGD